MSVTSVVRSAAVITKTLTWELRRGSWLELVVGSVTFVQPVD